MTDHSEEPSTDVSAIANQAVVDHQNQVPHGTKIIEATSERIVLECMYQFPGGRAAPVRVVASGMSADQCAVYLDRTQLIYDHGALGHIAMSSKMALEITTYALEQLMEVYQRCVTAHLQATEGQHRVELLEVVSAPFLRASRFKDN